MLSFIRCTVRP